MKKKTEARFEYDGLGFPIILIDVPMREFRGEMIPDIDYNRLQKTALEALSLKPVPLTGNEIRFIRQYFELTFSAFAEKFGVTHAAVIKWENSQDKIAKITPSTELYIRLYILEFLKANNEKFRNTFIAFDCNEELKKGDGRFDHLEPLSIDSRKLCA